MKSLAVKYRPNKFDDVCSQESVIKILRQQIETKTFKNSILFCGPSGCGKTTLARIFANEINAGIGNPIEIDAASNNGVDNVREIIKSASERSLEGQYKIYIIDECHVLTNQSWQAFLKCIEEPPTYTIFMFCTTDPQKIPATILNRVMRFNLTRIKSSTINNRLCYICESEGFINYKDGCEYISRISNGGMRDAISLLEKCSDYSAEINTENVLKCLGNFSYDAMISLINAIIDDNEGFILGATNSLYIDGYDLKLFINQFLSFCLDIQKYIITHQIEITKIPNSYIEQLNSCINFENSNQYYNYYIDKLLQLKNDLKSDTDMFTTVEVTLLQMARLK